MAKHFDAYSKHYDRGCYVINFRETFTPVESLQVTPPPTPKKKMSVIEFTFIRENNFTVRYNFTKPDQQKGKRDSEH
jgi:hypothetical protein